MANNNFEIKGLDALIKNLNDLPTVLANKIVRKALKEALEPLLAEIKAAAPVDSGKLREGISIKPGRSRGGTISMSIVSDTSYAGTVEFGSAKEKAQPHLRPAADRLEEKVTNDALQKIGDACEEELKR